MSQRPTFALNELVCPDSAWLRQEEREAGSYKQLDALLFNNQFDTFMQASFEKLPCIIKHSSSSAHKPSLESVFSQKVLSDVCTSADPAIPVLNNMSVRKYNEKHEREVYEFPDEDATVDSKKLKSLFKSGYTVQFFQPQRFSDGLHQICAGFEYLFGSLAGASAYLTPPHTQGLAPHWDDVEVFIFQLEGTKLWHLWEGPYLPETPSDDLSRTCEYLQQGGRVVQPVQVLLKPGDILYLPRGAIHEALSQDSFSTHVTVSVFQKNNMKGLVEKLLPALLQKAFDDSSTPAFTSLRQGLPINIPQTFGSFAAMKRGSSIGSGSDNAGVSEAPTTRQRTLASVKEALQTLALLVDEEDVDQAVDLFSDDFASHRLPPPELEGEEEEDETFTLAQIDGARALHARNKKKLRRAVFRICDPRLLHHRVLDMGGASVLFMGSCLDNDRMQHMGHPPLELELGDEEGCSEEEEEGDMGEYSENGEEGDEGEDAMSWASFSLPARMYKIVELLEGCYEQGTAHESSAPVNSRQANCITYADLVAMSTGENYSEDEIIATLATLHNESLLTVFLEASDEAVSKASSVISDKSSNKRHHNSKESSSKGKRKKQK